MAVCYGGQANSLHILKRYDKALQASTKATEADEAYWAGWGARGNALLYLGRNEEAAESFLMALGNPKR